MRKPHVVISRQSPFAANVVQNRLSWQRPLVAGHRQYLHSVGRQAREK